MAFSLVAILAGIAVFVIVAAVVVVAVLSGGPRE
jgi:hypothetical protein